MSEDQDPNNKEPNRRDFLYIATGSVAAVGAGFAAWPFIAQLAPSADVRALATTEVDLSSVQTGQQIKVFWQGKPVFIRRRGDAEIQEAKAVELSALPDPQSDDERVKEGRPEWLVMIGICTHLGCIPIGESGDYGGWFCPCHGSHYDNSGRIRKGPAPKNLEIPPYEFVADNRILIG